MHLTASTELAARVNEAAIQRYHHDAEFHARVHIAVNIVEAVALLPFTDSQRTNAKHGAIIGLYIADHDLPAEAQVEATEYAKRVRMLGLDHPISADALAQYLQP